jgi:hypothetical protein
LFMKHAYQTGSVASSRPPAPFNPDQMPCFEDISIAGCRRMPRLDGDTCILAAGTHVDDIIGTGTDEELNKLDLFLRTQFNVGKCESASDPKGFLYRGLRIRKVGRCHVTVDMREYEEREIFSIRFANLPKKQTQKCKDTVLDELGQAHYRAVVGKLIWIACQIRCDISCSVSQASSQLGKAVEADAIFVNRIIDHVEIQPITLHYHRLAKLSVPRLLRAACDAAFKRKDERDDKARGGLLMCLGTKAEDLVGLVSYHSAKIHRVCKSPTGAEAITISGAGDQMDNCYHLVLWFYPTAETTGEILTDAYSVTSSQFKLCSEVTPNLTVDFALIRGRVRDGSTTLLHQMGEYMAADGMTKGTTVAQKVLVNFLNTNLLGAKGVEMSIIEEGVSKKLQRAFTLRKIHPNNVSARYLENLADAVNAEIVGAKSNGRHYVEFAQCATEVDSPSRRSSSRLGPKRRNKVEVPKVFLTPSNHTHQLTRYGSVPSPLTGEVIVPRCDDQSCCGCGGQDLPMWICAGPCSEHSVCPRCCVIDTGAHQPYALCPHCMPRRRSQSKVQVPRSDDRYCCGCGANHRPMWMCHGEGCQDAVCRLCVTRSDTHPKLLCPCCVPGEASHTGEVCSVVETKRMMQPCCGCGMRISDTYYRFLMCDGPCGHHIACEWCIRVRMVEGVRTLLCPHCW